MGSESVVVLQRTTEGNLNEEESQNYIPPYKKAKPSQEGPRLQVAFIRQTDNEEVSTFEYTVIMFMNLPSIQSLYKLGVTHLFPLISSFG